MFKHFNDSQELLLRCRILLLRRVELSGEECEGLFVLHNESSHLVVQCIRVYVEVGCVVGEGKNHLHSHDLFDLVEYFLLFALPCPLGLGPDH